MPTNSKIIHAHKSLDKDPYTENFSITMSKREVKDQDGIKHNVQLVQIVPELQNIESQITLKPPKPSNLLLKTVGLSPRGVLIRKKRKHLRK